MRTQSYNFIRTFIRMPNIYAHTFLSSRVACPKASFIPKILFMCFEWCLSVNFLKCNCVQYDKLWYDRQCFVVSKLQEHWQKIWLWETQQLPYKTNRACTGWEKNTEDVRLAVTPLAHHLSLQPIFFVISIRSNISFLLLLVGVDRSVGSYYTWLQTILFY